MKRVNFKITINCAAVEGKPLIDLSLAYLKSVGSVERYSAVNTMSEMGKCIISGILIITNENQDLKNMFLKLENYELLDAYLQYSNIVIKDPSEKEFDKMVKEYRDKLTMHDIQDIVRISMDYMHDKNLTWSEFHYQLYEKYNDAKKLLIREITNDDWHKYTCICFADCANYGSDCDGCIHSKQGKSDYWDFKKEKK